VAVAPAPVITGGVIRSLLQASGVCRLSAHAERKLSQIEPQSLLKMNRKWGCAIRNPSPELPPEVEWLKCACARKNRRYLRNVTIFVVWFYGGVFD